MLELALGACVVLALAACSSSTATRTPPTVATPTPTPTATATVAVPSAPAPTPATGGSAAPAATIGPCTATALDIVLTPQDGLAWQAGAGNRQAVFTLTNAGPVACQVRAQSQPILVNGDGSALITGAPAAASDWIRVESGSTLTAMVQTSNLCTTATIIAPLRVAFVLPGGGGTVVAMPASPADVDANPGCMGDPSTPSGTIEMHPWAP
jgi:hypothetical protein